jgi:hypothetical protein
MLGNFMNSKVENSENAEKGYMAADMATNILGKINPVLGMYSKIGLAGFKTLDAAFGKRTNDFSMNRDVMSRMGSSYQSSLNKMLSAESKAGVKYGFASGKKRREDNAFINNASEEHKTI